MFFNRTNLNKLKELVSQRLLLSQEQLIYNYTQKCSYTDVKMKWKKDSSYDSIEIIHGSQELKPLISLKNCIANEPEGCIPIHSVSKRGLELGVPIKVARFLRQYPSVFEEYIGPKYNLPWFRLTPEAISLNKEERAVYEDQRSDLVKRLKKLIMMTREKKIPLKIIQGVQWYLGLPEDLLQNLEQYLDSSFKLVEMEDGLRGLGVDTEERMLSLIQKNAIKRGVYLEGSSMPLAIPLFPSKGLRLKRKISNWLNEFQQLPYVSPYEDSSHLNPNTDVSEKRVVGVLHELLSLFVEYSAERKKLLCLRTHLGLPQKFYRAFERHPHIFYLSLRNKTCTVLLKEAYSGDSAIETHPILKVREKYIRLMRKSHAIIKQRRQKGRSSELHGVNLDSEAEIEAAAKGYPIRPTTYNKLLQTHSIFSNSLNYYCLFDQAAVRQFLHPTCRKSHVPPSSPILQLNTSQKVVFNRSHNNQFTNKLSELISSNQISTVVSSKAASKNDNIVRADDEDGVSLGTMKLPSNIDIPRFESLLFQWANSLCQGANLPLPVPLKVDKITGGARLGFITIGDGETEVPVYIDCLVFPATDGSGPIFRAIRNGAMKDQSPPGEPRIMQSLLLALKKSVEIARV
ncbi:Plant organelle RNA recognition domain [Macleaya cordata]|uniref:Plant organelle RNA recognition domain n=1 Tax=Macleaya cordata TaxID=56857 RepID=A0A200R8R1_MACCD|nr:Plant organelle RNA recognition domain [Macleaya cordata]